MASISLLRHGQASFGADNYDQLSPTGHRQALWLGQHLKDLNRDFDRIVTGTMVRHRETAEGVLSGLGASVDVESHAGLNEYDFQGLLNPYKAQYPDHWLATGNAGRDYYHNMKQALQCWMHGIIDNDGQDTWPSFCERVLAGFEFAYNSGAKRTLVVSSGGVIGVILAEVLGLDHHATGTIILQIKNTSLNTLLYHRNSFALDNFNDISHLMKANRQDSITFA